MSDWVNSFFACLCIAARKSPCKFLGGREGPVAAGGLAGVPIALTWLPLAAAMPFHAAYLLQGISAFLSSSTRTRWLSPS